MRSRIFSLAAMAALVLALTACAAMPLPVPESEGDCLVVIRTKVENPDQSPVKYNFSFKLASGGREKVMPTSPKSYMAFVVSGPDKFVSRHSNVTADGWTGAAQEEAFNVDLPYKAGYVVIAPAMFVNRIEKSGENGFASTFEVKTIGSDDKAELIDGLKAREGIGAWSFEE